MSEERITDRDARVVFYKNISGEYKNIYYELHDGTKTISVVEHYTLKPYYDTFEGVPSDTTPDRIEFFVKDGEALYYAFFRKLKERPSVEWILSFGF